MAFDLIYAVAQRLMTMDDVAWAKHANPKSVYSRIFTGTPVFLALWSPFWIGVGGVGLIALAAFWIWLNPRLFAPPQQTDNWASQAVLGERAFLNRAETPVPAHHVQVASVATALSAGFLFLAIFGFYARDFWFAFAAWHGSVVSKVWFCDRMAWLWRDMKDSSDQYRAWDRAEWGIT